MWELRERRAEEWSEAPSILCYVDLKIANLLPSSLIPVHFCFHTQHRSLDQPPPLPLPLPPCFSVNILSGVH